MSSISNMTVLRHFPGWLVQTIISGAERNLQSDGSIFSLSYKMLGRRLEKFHCAKTFTFAVNLETLV